MGQSRISRIGSIPKILIIFVFVGIFLWIPRHSLAEGQSGEKPRILFMIAEQNIGQKHFVYWWSWWGQSRSEFMGETVDMLAVETTLKESFLNNGFEVVDISATTGTFELSNAYRIADLTDKGAREIAKKVNAEIVIKGKALAKEGPRTPGSAVGSYLADVTATAIRVDTGRVLASAKGHGVSRHISEVTGGTEALSRAATELADRLMEQIHLKSPGLNK
jgi:hypothetical protein